MKISSKFAVLIISICVSTILFADFQEDIQNKQILYQREIQELLSNQQIIESATHQQRIAILQEAQKCFQQATTREEYRICEQREQEARKKNAEKINAKNEALKEQAKKLHEKLGKDR